MPDPKFISPGRSANPGLDFETLKQQGLEIVQRLAGDVWTDYNEHDPGVTILEQLCYALTELSYRAEMPIEDLLCDAATGRLDPKRTALFPPEAMLTGAPVTAHDYRRLLIDRVPGVANAWLTPARAADRGAVHGLHEIELYIPETDAASRAESRRAAVRIARRVAIHHRGLCEDIVGIHVLTPASAHLRATITVDRSATAETVLARAFYHAGRFLAPEVRRQPLDQRVADASLVDVFSGPLMTGGVIGDDQLGPRTTRVALAELTRELGQVEGVALVRDVELHTEFGNLGAAGDSAVTLPGRRVLQLDTGDVDGRFGVRLIRDGAPYHPYPAAVHRELQRLWAEHRRRFDLRSQREQLLAPLSGRPADLGAYHSIQHQFPNVYGINAHGLPAEASDTRQAQARQLKAYLLIFEQILADAFARLASAGDLFSTSRAPRVQPVAFLDRSVPDVDPLLAPAYKTRLPKVVRSGDRALERRNRALDLMLATYGESVGPPLLLPRASARGPETASLLAQVRAKRALLRRLPWLAGRRGCGIDYLDDRSRGALVSAEVKSRIQLGMDAVPHPLAELLSDEGMTLVGTAPQADRVSMIHHARHIDTTFEAVEHVPAPPRSSERTSRTISEDILLAADDQAQYRIGSLPDDDGVSVVCRSPSQPIWQLVGRYGARGTALSEVSRLVDTLRRIERRLRRLSIVEHTLLRFGRSGRGFAEDGPPFECNFTATAIVALPAREASDATYRTAIHALLRANVPPHIVLDVLFLRLSDAVAFEALHGEWLGAMRSGRGAARIEACRHMRAFLRSGRQ